MSALRLPSGDSPTLSLVHPTDNEIKLQLSRNGESWRGALTQDAYVRREAHLATTALSSNSGITYWILVDTAEPEATRRVLCGCESLRKRAIASRRGITRDLISHGIGSVFCPPEHRGRGYAQRMMRELGPKLRTHQVAETGLHSLFSVLYSDIGKKFYASFGWKPFPSSHITVPASCTQPKGLISASPLLAGDLEELCASDEEALRKTLANRSESAPQAVVLLPDLQTVRWHHAREDFVGKELHGRSPDVKGAIISLGEGKRAWCYWTRMWYNPDREASKGNTLHILRLVVEDEALATTNGVASNSTEHNGTYGHATGKDQKIHATEALLRAAQVQAAAWNMEEVEVWSPTATTVDAARQLYSGAKVVDRDGESIASLMWYGAKEEEGRVEWISNEKYGWC